MGVVSVSISVSVSVSISISVPVPVSLSSFLSLSLPLPPGSLLRVITCKKQIDTLYSLQSRYSQCMQHIFPNIPSLCSGLIPYPLILNAYRAFPITYVVSHPLPSPHLPNTYETLPIPHPLSIHTTRFLRPPPMSHPHVSSPSHPIPPLHNFTASLANFQNPTHTHTHVLYTQENKTAQDTPPQARTPSRLQNAHQKYICEMINF